MVKISKDEVAYLIKAGYKWGVDIHRTNSNKHKYFMTEKASALKDLEEFRAGLRSEDAR